MPLPRRSPLHLAGLALLLPLLGAAGPEPAPDRPQALAALQLSRPVPQQAMAAATGWGAVYAPVAGSAYGLAVNRADPAGARAAAEARCRRSGGGGEGCRLVAEFTGRCGAVAQAVDRAVLVSLRPLGTGSILGSAAGAGETVEAAGRAALAACGRDEGGGGGGRGTICVVVASACAER